MYQNLMISGPKGETGADGAPGPAGPIGPQGAAGERYQIILYIFLFNLV